MKDIETLSRAITFRTVSFMEKDKIDYREYEAFLGFLEESFPRFFEEAEVERIHNYSLLCRLKGRDGIGKKGDSPAPVLLLAHYDVVPPGAEEEWCEPPFSGTIRDEELWGRGSLDDKASLIAILQAMESLLEEGRRPKRSLYFAFGHDEEIGGGEGAAAIAETLKKRGLRFSFVLDEGMNIVDPELFPVIDRPLALVGVAEKGHVDILLRSEGESGHSSTPPPSTAAGKIARAVCRIERHPFPHVLTGTVEGLFRTISREKSGLLRFVFSHPRLFFPLLKRIVGKSPGGNAMIRTTQAVTMLSGSEKENVLPSVAEAVLNCRIIPGESLDSVLERIRRVVKDSKLKVETIPHLMGNDPVPPSDIDGEGYRLISAAVGRVYPDYIVSPTIVLGTTDSRHYAALTENIYRFVPLKVDKVLFDTIHGKDERVPVEDFRRAAEVYRNLLQEL